MPRKNSFGAKMRQLRAAAGLSQQAYADKLDITRGYLSDLERDAKEPSISLLRQICKRAKTTPNDLLGY